MLFFMCFITFMNFLFPSAGAAQIPPPATDKAEALAAAARKGDVTAVAKLLDEGVDVNTKFRYGTTALSFAADHGQLEVVKLLLARGASVNVKDTFYGATPLTWVWMLAPPRCSRSTSSWVTVRTTSGPVTNI